MNKVNLLLILFILIKVASCSLDSKSKVKPIKISRFKPYFDTTELRYDDSTNNRIINLSDTSKIKNIKKNIKISFLVEGDFVQDSSTIDSLVYNYIMNNHYLIDLIKLDGYFSISFEFFRATDFLDISYNERNNDRSLILNPKNLIAFLAWSKSKLFRLSYYFDGDSIGEEFYPKHTKFNFDSVDNKKRE